MNGGSGGGRGGRKVSGMPLVDRKERDDEDLMLFRELDKRERDRIASLLQPVSEEFEPNAAAGTLHIYTYAFVCMCTRVLFYFGMIFKQYYSRKLCSLQNCIKEERIWIRILCRE